MSEIRLSPAPTCNLWRQALGFAFSFFSYAHMIAGGVGESCSRSKSFVL